MKIYVCADIEGVAGITSKEQCLPGNAEYERARRLMTAEVNAAVEGAFEGGASEVVVADSHFTFTNLLPELLDERALLIQGRPRPGAMCPALDGSFAGVFFVGHHAGAHRAGVLAHSVSGSTFAGISLNGVVCNEVMLHGALAGEMGVPVALLTGDDRLIADAAPIFPGAALAGVKTALGARAACSLAPARAQALIRTRAAEAMRALPTLRPYVIAPPIRLELAFNDVAMADHAALIPVAERSGSDRLAFTCRSVGEALAWIMVVVSLALAVR